METTAYSTYGYNNNLQSFLTLCGKKIGVTIFIMLQIRVIKDISLSVSL